MEMKIVVDKINFQKFAVELKLAFITERAICDTYNPI